MTGFLVLYWTAFALQTQFAVDLPSPLEEVWNSATPLIVGLGLGFVAGLYVGRWSVLIVAPTPLVPLGVLNLVGYSAPYHESTPPLSGWPWWVAAMAAPLVIGVLMRRRAFSPRTRSPGLLDRN
ncbi:MAG: hypothetical protein ACREX3_23485 [Gammaproteobacteria bacterium]